MERDHVPRPADDADRRGRTCRASARPTRTTTMEEPKMRNCHLLMTVLVVLAAVSVGASAQYVNFDLYWVDGTNGDIWAYPDSVGTVISAPADFSSVTCLAISQDRGLLVGQAFAGIERIDTLTGDVTTIEPYAYNVGELCEDGESGDIFWISGPGYQELYVIEEGTTASEMSYMFSDQPLDIDVIPYGPHAGNILVLLDSYNPPSSQLIEMTRTGQFEFSIVDTVATMWETNPQAFSFMPDGTVIVVDLTDGMTLYDLDDGYIGQLGQFQASDLLDITVGSDGTIYVYDSNYGYVLRFDQLGNQVFPPLYGPVEGGAIEAAGYTPTPPGSNVPVHPANNVDILFEEVTDGGYTSAETFESSSRTSPGGNTIPAFADAPGGRSDFTYINATTSAVYENLIQVDIYLPGSRFFVAQGTGGEFHDVTIVGSIEDARGVISRFDSPVEAPGGGSRLIEGPTEFVLVEDTRPVSDVVDAKFARLISRLTGPEQAPSKIKNLIYIRKYLLRRAMHAQRLYVSGYEEAAVLELARMNSDIRLLAGWRIPNSSASQYGNIAGELLSMSKTLMFSLDLLAGGSRGAGVDVAPDRLALAAPNPVYGECRMQLSGPAGARAVAAIYTVSGRLVTTLFDGELEGGSHELVWDGTDDAGNKVASGVYMTRALAGAEVATGKLVLIR